MMNELHLSILGDENWSNNSFDLALRMEKELQSSNNGLKVLLNREVVEQTDAVLIIQGAERSSKGALRAYNNFVPLIAIPQSGGFASIANGTYLDNRNLSMVRETDEANASNDLKWIAKNRKHLKSRLEEVGIGLNVYSLSPQKFIRINPRNPISVDVLIDRLERECYTSPEFSETGIDGIYRSSTSRIGQVVNGIPNEFFNVNYFIQDIASAFAVYALGIKPGQSFLDMCASPGMKTLLAYDLAGGDLKVTAIEKREKRFNQLKENLRQHWIEAYVWRGDARYYRGPEFDRVLVDVPCSSEGVVKIYDKSVGKIVSTFDSRIEFSPEELFELNEVQRGILQNGFNHLKEGGVLVYSTCALNKYENEKNVEYFLNNNSNARIDLSQLPSPNINYNIDQTGVRVIPGESKGFYFTRITKTNR